ncbi:MAG TPA: alpha/beta hydrolase [Candidatus Dormibacteraeota bacterium]
MGARPGRSAVVVPGRMFGPHTPLLMYAAQAAERRGARVYQLQWPEEELAIASASGEALSSWVTHYVGAALDALDLVDAKPLIVGKSLATYAARVAAERDLPAVWLTPLLAEAYVVDALRDSLRPFLLVGGTADAFGWDSRVAHALSPHVLEVEGADHGMFVPGELAASATVLGSVATAIEQFFDEIIWVEDG